MTEDTVPPNPAMTLALRAVADGTGAMSYETFVATALYHPELGYYRRERRRVGRADDTDFYTSSSVGGGVFGALIREAAAGLVGGADALREYTLVEIGAEPGASIFEGERAAFAEVMTVRVGESPAIPARAIVFANELFDAQPFRRFRYREGAWRELGIRITDAGALAEIEWATATPEVLAPSLLLPTPWYEGFTLDLSSAADRLMESLLVGDWRGAVIFPDYGKTFDELLATSPTGTARAYYRHAQSNDLLSRPGEQDLTYHVVWDALATRVRAAGFDAVACERQEVFFMRRASGELEKLFARATTTRDPVLTGRIRELIHPAHLGAKFQVLSGTRL